MEVKQSEAKHKNCTNCGQVLNGQDKYCSSCGQATYSENDISSFFQHFLSDYFTFDSKIFRSIVPLFSKPGFLTLEYLKGKRASYIPPLRLFIFTSIIFFLFLSVLDVEQATTVEGDSKWDRFFESRLPKLFFVLSPIFALLVALFFKKRDNSYLVHFLFSLHFHATLFSLGSIYVFISWALILFDGQLINFFLLIISIIYIIVYLWKALRTVYREEVWGTLWRLFLLALMYIGLIGISVTALALFSN